MNDGANKPLVLGRDFLATAGAVIDMPNKMISFKNINPSVYYKAVPTDEIMQLASSVSVLDKYTHVDSPQDNLVDKEPVEEILNKTDCTMQKKSDSVVKGELEHKGIKGDPHLKLIPKTHSSDMIEYKVKCKGTSKPFTKVRAIFTSEMKEKGMEAVTGLMSHVLKLKMFDGGTCFGASSIAHPE